MGLQSSLATSDRVTGTSSEKVVPYAALWSRQREKPVAGLIPFKGVLLGASLLGTAGAIPPPKRRLSATLVQAGGGPSCSTGLSRHPGGGPAGAWLGLEASADHGLPLHAPGVAEFVRAGGDGAYPLVAEGM